jgi:hypothetical protein
MSNLSETERALARSLDMTDTEWALYRDNRSDVSAEAERARNAAAQVDAEEAAQAERSRRAAA